MLLRFWLCRRNVTQSPHFQAIDTLSHFLFNLFKGGEFRVNVDTTNVVFAFR